MISGSSYLFTGPGLLPRRRTTTGWLAGWLAGRWEFELTAFRDGLVWDISKLSVSGICRTRGELQ